MIQGLFETHINVSCLEQSADFYERLLGLQVLHRDEARRSIFYWVGEPGKAMLGIRENYPSPLVQRQHFAFLTTLDGIRDARHYLSQRGILTRNFYGDGTEHLYAFAFMPAVSIYFSDPDGHSLELLAMLPDSPRPELGILPWAEWEQLHGRG